VAERQRGRETEEQRGREAERQKALGQRMLTQSAEHNLGRVAEGQRGRAAERQRSREAKRQRILVIRGPSKKYVESHKSGFNLQYKSVQQVQVCHSSLFLLCACPLQHEPLQ
jgi:hypothetical protein